ncbi:type II toxin-antitoxin system ParD family antitoxin [Aerosakkonemataceae cyanobacterium BLCC-F154]|uniref:Type II toxin-antitoxin system ParD family antitoxin n=1 Tax=Floridaenema fluviatile BLCC-F154 TaxID=3153640 RepID=A0ABV4YDM5_9CYAN
MNILLTPELEEFVNKQVESGKYQDGLAVIREALQLLEERQQIYKGRFEELKREVMIGVEQLERGEKIDGETAMRQLTEEITQRSKK